LIVLRIGCFIGAVVFACRSLFGARRVIRRCRIGGGARIDGFGRRRRTRRLNCSVCILLCRRIRVTSRDGVISTRGWVDCCYWLRSICGRRGSIAGTRCGSVFGSTTVSVICCVSGISSSCILDVWCGSGGCGRVVSGWIDGRRRIDSLR